MRGHTGDGRSSIRRRGGAVLCAMGIAVGAAAVFPSAASANSFKNPPRAFSPEAGENTFTAPVQPDPDQCQGIIATPGSDPAVKQIDTTDTNTLVPGGTVNWIFSDTAHENTGTDNFAIHDCTVVYPADHFTAADFADNGTGEPAPGSEAKFKQGFTQLDSGLLTGIGDETLPVHYSWHIPNDASLDGQWICNFAKDTANNHSGKSGNGNGNRKAVASCFQVQFSATDLTDTASPKGPVAPGTSVTFTYQETNTGDVPISGVTIGSNNCATATPTLSGGFNVGDTNHNGVLDPGETWTYTCTVSAPSSGMLTDNVTANGTSTPAAPTEHATASVEVTTGTTGTATTGTATTGTATTGTATTGTATTGTATTGTATTGTATTGTATTGTATTGTATTGTATTGTATTGTATTGTATTGTATTGGAAVLPSAATQTPPPPPPPAIPTQVLPTVLTRTPAQLPFTGSNTRALLLLAGMLLVLGGVTMLVGDGRRSAGAIKR